MGMYLVGRDGLYLNWYNWRGALMVAYVFGWHPEGTRLSEGDDDDWKGSYFSNDWQSVSCSDAKALACALERAAGAIAAEKPMTLKQREAIQSIGGWVITELMNYARGGGFLIT